MSSTSLFDATHTGFETAAWHGVIDTMRHELNERISYRDRIEDELEDLIMAEAEPAAITSLREIVTAADCDIEVRSLLLKQCQDIELPKQLAAQRGYRRGGAKIGYSSARRSQTNAAQRQAREQHGRAAETSQMMPELAL